MQRVGIFTGNLYNDEDDIHECAIVVSPSASDSDAAVKDAKDYALYKRIINCKSCKNCPEAQKARD